MKKNIIKRFIFIVRKRNMMFFHLNLLMMITLNLTGMEMSVMNVSNNFKINGCGRYGYDCKK